tara:strand:+ start:1018 stop:1170 length:153 start_codon:yes stop_codon:yes gene_type:complete
VLSSLELSKPRIKLAEFIVLGARKEIRRGKMKKDGLGARNKRAETFFSEN